MSAALAFREVCYCSSVLPRDTDLSNLPPEELAEIRSSLEETDRGEGIVLTQEQLEHWAATGEWPWLQPESSD